MADSPIVEFYIQNYMLDGSLVTTETKFQEVPFSGDPVIAEPKVKCEMGKAGSFEFKMERTSPYYNSLLQMKTLMRVTYFGTTIFRGRVLTIDKTMYGSRTVHCEGDFAFLLDSYQIGTKEETRSKIGVLAYLNQIIDQHNSNMSGEPAKQFVLGEVPGQYTSATKANQKVAIPSSKSKQKFGDTSWNTSMDRLEDLLSNFGGYFRTRFVKGTDGEPDVTYLDWYDRYYNATTNTQTIEIAKNIIDISGPTEVENLFTIVIPIGKSNSGENVYISDYWPIVKKGHSKVRWISVPELASVPLYSDAELNSDFHRKQDYLDARNKFGKIWKIVDFENANTPEKLFAYAKDWIKNNYMPELTQWSVGALDLKVVNSENQVLLCGDRVTLIHPEVDQTRNEMTIISVDYDLYNPEHNKYVIGYPSQQINASYGVKAKDAKTKKVSSKSRKKSGITASPSPGINSPPNDAKDDIEKTKTRLRNIYVQKTEWGEDILLDNPTAFLTYKDDGTEKDKKEAVSAIADFVKDIEKTKKTKKAELLAEAITRGVSVDDPQLLIDFTPSVKQKQTTWKAQTATKFVNTYGVPADEAEIILNETAGQSHLAGLVDDDGNWTDYAIQQGATTWDPKMKETAIRVRGILNGTENTQNSKYLSGAQDGTVSNLLNIGNWSVTDGDGKTMDIGDSLFNAAEDGVNKSLSYLNGVFTGGILGNKKGFNLQSDNTQVDGNNGGIGLGKNGTMSGWDVALNKQITYTADGHTYTVPAHSLAAADMHFTAKYDSLRAELAVVDTLLADYAQIGTLVALNAQVQSLEADTIKTNELKSRIADIATLDTMTIHSTGNVYTDYGYIRAPYIYLGESGNAKSLANALTTLRVVSAGNNNYKIQKQDFDDADWADIPNTTFSRAVSYFTWGGGSGKLTVRAWPQNQAQTINFSLYGSNKITSNGDYKYTAEYENKDGDDEVIVSKTITVDVPQSISGTGQSMRCVKKENTYPGSATYVYTFTLEGIYSFKGDGSTYTFYRSSW